MQYTLRLSNSYSREESMGHLVEYLANRYINSVSVIMYHALVNADEWIARNSGELSEVGLVTPDRGGVVNALLHALYEMTLTQTSIPAIEEACRAPFREVVAIAQKYIDAEK